MTYKQVALILKIIGIIYFIISIADSTMAIVTIFYNPVFNRNYAGLLEEKITNPIIQIVIPNILISLKFMLLGILMCTTFVCIARYLSLIKDEKTV
jgi:hypothetical protein